MEASRLNKTKIKKKKPQWIKVVLTALLVILIGAGAYFYHVYNDVANAVKKMNVQLASKETAKVNFNNGDPISILMVGVDERQHDSGRTDSMIVITINPKTKTTKLLSIPRDTRTELINKSNPSKKRFDKINAAYAYGGIQESIDTVENFLNVPIDYYIKVNMQGFKDIVDAVGGIDVDNKYAFELDGVTLKTGPQHLDGLQALEYARMRHQDPKGDFGRQERQREVISKIIQKGKSISILTKYNTILKALENNIQTDLTLDDIIGIQSTYKPAAKHMDQLEIAGNGATINEIWYFVVDEQERQRLSDQMRESLGLSTATVAKIYDNTETVNQNTNQTVQNSAASNTRNQSYTSKSKVSSSSTNTSSAAGTGSTTHISNNTGSGSNTGTSNTTGSSSSTGATSTTGGSSGSIGATSTTGGSSGSTGSGSSTGSNSTTGSGNSAGSSNTNSTGTTK